MRDEIPRIPWRALAAAALSALLPGSGQLLLGARVRGGLLLGGTITSVGLAGLAWRQERVALLILTLRPGILLLALCLNLTIGPIRWLVTADAFRLGRQRLRHTAARWRHRTQAFVVASLVAFFTTASAPHLLAGYYAYQLYALLVTVFPDQPPVSVPISTPYPDTGQARDAACGAPCDRCGSTTACRNRASPE